MTFYPMRALARSSVVIVALGACPDEESLLAGHSYVLESAEGFEPVSGTTIRVSFPDAKSFGFSSGCNGISGNYAINDSKLVAGELLRTTIGCDVPLAEQEEWLLDFMTSGPRVKVDGDRLILSDADATLTFLDREVASPDRPLVGTVWTVNALITQTVAEGSTALANPPTLKFGVDGDLEIFTSCNEGRGEYDRHGEMLTISAPGYTKVACSEEEKRFETHVQAVLAEGAITFEVDERRLTLTRGELGLSALALD